ncbi:hypothetical protein [Rhizobium straminoryzae]|uniref:Lipoprotein n=1 Tax=Rhizobium straminoryzae TaxID=1387186 RepID=A0A549TCY7_9HYPH|nr:hypothetical protein [Rhizobium straminoryzae]TRL39824.1 hypothetical protein FNA46_07770 [Rhizobium straminoryzae]
MKKYRLLFLTFGLVGCVHQPQGSFHRISDGLRVDANPQIAAAFQKDRVICDGEASKAALQSTEKNLYAHTFNLNTIFDACLAERGYLRK